MSNVGGEMYNREGILTDVGGNDVNIQLPACNLDISLGGKDGIKITLTVKRTLINRFKYWMLCQFFPFKIEMWE